jgi:nucleoside-diphosphate-sugar epimerase
MTTQSQPAAPMRALVAGATGYSGQAVVEVLRDAGALVWAHVRPDRRDLAEWQARWHDRGAQVVAVPWQEQAMADLIREQQITHVFCCIGTTRARMGRDGAAANSYQAVDYGLTKLLVSACAAAGGVQRFVYVSSLGAGPSAAGAYLQARWQAECAVQQAGVPFTIARPSFLSGDRAESRPGERIGAVVTDALLAVAGAVGAAQTRDRYRSNNAASLARALVRLAADPAAVNQVVLSERLHDPV